MDLVALAHRIVAERFPDARAAVLAGSVSAGRATATSDLDIVVLSGSGERVRETIRVDGVPVELFVHTDESVAYWFERERQAGGCTLAHMLATGLPLAGDEVDPLQVRAREHLAAGPPAWTREQLDYRRYALTDALDDLAGATDAGERDAVAGQVLVMAGEGDEEQALRERAAPYGERVRFVPNVRGQVDEFLSACDLLAYAPSPTETDRPRVIVMAQLVGLPVLATDPEGTEAVSRSGAGTIVYPHNDPRAFAAAIRENRQPRVTGVDGLRAVEATLAAYESDRTGKTVEIKAA